MRLAVTGCNGRVGRHVVAFALKAGHEVQGIDSARLAQDPGFVEHPNFSFSGGDLRNYEQVLNMLRGTEAVIHLAGIAQPFDYAVDTHNTYVLVMNMCARNRQLTVPSPTQ